MLNRKLIALTLAAASMSVGTTGAFASTIVGNPSQDNSQNTTTAQGANQNAGGTGVVVGPTTQVGLNANNGTQGNVQAIGSPIPGGSTLVGNPSQKNSQGAATTQQVNQAAGGGVVIGPTTQVQANLNTTTQGSVAIIF
jgi:hypothetical protein